MIIGSEFTMGRCDLQVIKLNHVNFLMSMSNYIWIVKKFGLISRLKIIWRMVSKLLLLQEGHGFIINRRKITIFSPS